jgi:hypothetical protein
MLGKLRSRLSYANVVATMALFVALGGTGAYAANTVFSSDIVDGEVKAPDIAANAVDSARVRDNTLNTFDVHSFIGDDVIDGTLTGADIGDGTVTRADIADGTILGTDVREETIDGNNIVDGSLDAFDIGFGGSDIAVNIGSIAGTNCVNKALPDLGNVLADHLVLTPSLADAHGGLIYDARYNAATGVPVIHVCNFGNATVDDATTHFDVLIVKKRRS